LIPSSPEKGGDFVLNGALQNEARTQPTQLGQLLGIRSQFVAQQFSDLCLEPGTRRYSVHLA
jgi:hypothetical protein